MSTMVRKADKSMGYVVIRGPELLFLDKENTDYKCGIRAILPFIAHCRKCGKQTNLLYETTNIDKLTVACSRQCSKELP